MKFYQRALCLLASLALVSAESFYGESPVESFLRMSSNKNSWDFPGQEASWAVCIIFYAIYIVTYLFVVVAIFYDVMSKLREYSEMIEDDKVTLQRLNYDINNPDFLQALNNRLRGIKDEHSGDDQLISEAMKLEKSQY